MGRRGGVAVAIVALVIGAAGCGDEGKSYSDAKIVDQLHLEDADDAYAIDGDPFCEVEKKLLNDAGEVEDAVDSDKSKLVVASKAGNAGVTGRNPFARECQKTALKRLDKLDPAPKND
jgi:hypothetical protein